MPYLAATVGESIEYYRRFGIPRLVLKNKIKKGYNSYIVMKRNFKHTIIFS